MTPAGAGLPGGHQPPRATHVGSVLILCAAVLWGSLGIAGRIAFRAGIAPLEAAFFRAAGAFVVLLAGMLVGNRSALRVRGRDLMLFALFGLISVAIFFFAYLFAISQTSVATAAILLYTAPAFVILISALAFHEPLTRAKMGAVGLAMVGCVLVVRGYKLETLHLTGTGVLAGLLAGFTYGMYSVFGKTALRRYSPLTTLTYALGFGALFLGAAALPSGVVGWSHPRSGWWAIAYLAVVTTLLAQGLYLSGLRRLEAGRASLMATLEPVVAAALGYAILGEGLDAWQVVGGTLVLSAVITARWIHEPTVEAPSGELPSPRRGNSHSR